MILSILSLWRYDRSVLADDVLILPAGIDRDALTVDIVTECAELSLIYPDPDIFKRACKAWSTGMQYKWTKLQQSSELTYQPIENYDRHEEFTDTSTGKGTTKMDSTGSSEATQQLAGMNDGSYENSQKDTGTSKDGSTGSSTSENKVVHTSHVHGNVGVTTSQQMLEAERDVADWSIYDVIVQDFKQRFCVLVY